MKTVIVTLALSLLATPALAQPEAPTPEGADVVYEPVTEHIFDGEQVDGRTKNPDGERVTSLMGKRFRSLVSIREDFRPELLASADDL